MDASTTLQLVTANATMDVEHVEEAELRKFTPFWAYIPLVEDEH